MSEFNPTKPVNDIIDLDLHETRKKKFRIDKDDNRILELNTSDMNILNRVSEAYPKLNALQERASKLMDGINTSETDNPDDVMHGVSEMAQRLKEVDTEMRSLIDYMFDSNVSDVTAPDGSMYDPFNGSFRFEYIITLLMKQYEDNLQSEFNKMEKQLKKHTDKYTRG
jgi:hypothetical protein